MRVFQNASKQGNMPMCSGTGPLARMRPFFQGKVRLAGSITAVLVYLGSWFSWNGSTVVERQARVAAANRNLNKFIF